MKQIGADLRDPLALDCVNLYACHVPSSSGHIVHFLLLSDFACFLLAHIYNPDKLSGGLLRPVPVCPSHVFLVLEPGLDAGGGAPSRTSCEAAGPGGQSTLGMTSNPVSTGRVDKPICRPPLLHLEMASLTTGIWCLQNLLAQSLRKPAT